MVISLQLSRDTGIHQPVGGLATQTVVNKHPACQRADMEFCFLSRDSHHKLYLCHLRNKSIRRFIINNKLYK